MLKLLLLILISLAPKLALPGRVQSNYDKYNTISGDPATSTTYTTASAVSSSPTYTSATSATSSWQPSTTFVAQQQQQQRHVGAPTAMAHDWYILQAATNAAAVAETAAAEIQATYSANQQQEQQQQQQQRYWHKAIAPFNIYQTAQIATMEQQRQQQQLPLTYYAYNGSSDSGNYNAPTQDMRVMEPYVLPISNRGGAVMPSGGMHKKQQAIDKSNRSNKNNNSNISKRNTDASIVNNHINRENMNTYNNNNSNSSHIQSQNQHNKQYIEHTTATTSNVNNANSIVVQPQHATLFGWQDIESKIIAALRGVDNAKGQNANDKSDDEKQRTNAERDATVAAGSVVNGMNNLKDAQFSEVLLPLRNILDKVTQFCVTLKHIINEDEGDLASSQLITADESDEAFASTASAAAEHAASILQTLYTVTTAGDTAQLLAEVQGQRGVPTIPPTAHSTNTRQSQTTEMVWTPQLTTPQSTAVTASVRGATTNANTTQQTAKSFTTTSLGIGRGKKLKKKLKKLILPLLLAYKLKFITLLPLLIGGLVLLVGSTGMAGFFFALFLTVITLKGGGNVSKSIVIKKDW